MMVDREVSQRVITDVKAQQPEVHGFVWSSRNLVELAQRGKARDKLSKIRDVKSSRVYVYSTEVGHYP